MKGDKQIMFDNLDDFIKTRDKDKKIISIYSVPFTADTETSHNHNEENPLAWIYQWAICIDAKNEIALTGRTVGEFIDALLNIDNELKEISKITGRIAKVIIYFHNLPYDYTYLYKHLLQFFDVKNEFWLDKRHILKADIGDHIILKDSYKYFGMSLEKVCESYNVVHKKLVGAVDYNEIHYTSDPLSAEEWQYQLNDVFGLQEALIKDFEINNYTTASAPLTSTGKVRQLCRMEYEKYKDSRKEFLKTKPSRIAYKVMRKVFAGGYTHGNRFYRSVTINSKYFGHDIKIKHRDFRSDYPSCMRKYKFPSGRIDQIKKPTINDFFDNKYCVWGIIGADSIELKDKLCPFPFLSASKIDTKSGAEVCDNGRVLECMDKIMIYVTSWDLKILLEQYNFTNIKVLMAYRSLAKPLPEWFINVIDTQYKSKSDLKARVKYLEKIGANRDDIYDANMVLLRSKGFLNGLYGMCAMDYCKALIERDENFEPQLQKIDYESCIDKHYGIYKGKSGKKFVAKSANGFLPYQWSMFVTSTARYELYNCCKICGENFLYADTDSIFYIETSAIEKKFKKLNEHKRKHAIKKGMYIITDNGKIETYDSFDIEDEGTEFRFLHSKCYAYITDNKLKVTVSGVASRRLIGVKDNKPIYYYSSDELGSIENLKDNFVFKKCGSTKIKYYSLEPELLEVAEGKFETVSDGAIITENQKTLSLGDDDFIVFYYDEIRNGRYHA